jgi:hypothetical protein
MAHGGRHNADDRLAAALALGHPIASAAKLAGVSERTAFRRLQDASFRSKIEGLKAESFEHAATLLVSVSTAAVTTLHALLSSPTDSVRLGAARAIITASLQLREATSLEERLAALERRLDDQGRRDRWA